MTHVLNTTLKWPGMKRKILGSANCLPSCTEQCMRSCLYWRIINISMNWHTLHLYWVVLLSVFIRCVYIYIYLQNTGILNTWLVTIGNQPFCTLLFALYAIHVFYECSIWKSYCVLFLETIEYRVTDVMTFYMTLHRFWYVYAHDTFSQWMFLFLWHEVDFSQIK